MTVKQALLTLALAGGALSLHAQHRPTPAAKAKAPTKADPAMAASITRGAVVYKNVCITCHMADGGGVPNMNPPLIKTEYVLGDKARLAHIVLAGLAEPIEIDGNDYKQHMPAQNYLTDQQVADVLTYVRNKFGNKASAVQVAEVKAVRATLPK
ncbi:cytochrome c [Hymenobacter sp. UV11]|uniref:c-type cytochrome n=1 Tax=Hymenobacter sp. UV11 TaxID=1849735 RepID=UPI00105FA7E0|nr:cytochrome c [Hymenobacter sp. UV11]TDN39748.1 cytochrome C [Hymenobacter sp. UV11]TFZ67133.1 cytochrome c [Hymenobacter sp. UV11]